MVFNIGKLGVCKKMFFVLLRISFFFFSWFVVVSLYVRKTRILVVAFKDEGTMPLLVHTNYVLNKISSFIS